MSLIASYKEHYKHFEDYFVVVDAKKSSKGHTDLVFQCQKCLPIQKVKCSTSSITNLSTHVKRKHIYSMTKFKALLSRKRIHEDEESEATVSSSSSQGKAASTPTSVSDVMDSAQGSEGPSSSPVKKSKLFGNPAVHVSQDRVLQLTCNFKRIIESYLPFTIVRTEGFKKFLTGLQPTRHSPAYETVMRRINLSYSIMMKNLKNDLEKPAFVALTTDAWSTVNKGYLGYTCSWYNDKLERVNAVLGCKRITERHTYDVLAKEIANITKEFG